ncbi:hypothetical protein BB560_004799, partial [Smittium megazygosporum]
HHVVFVLLYSSENLSFISFDFHLVSNFISLISHNLTMLRFLALLFLSGLSIVSAFTSVLNAGATECFYENLVKGNHFSISYETVAKYKISFVLRNSRNSALVERRESSEGNFGTTAGESGRFTYCFTNPLSHAVVVNFNPHSPDEEKFLSKIESTDEIKKEIGTLSHSIEDLIDHFIFMHSRSDENEGVIAKLQSRVFWWAVLQSVALISVCGWQVYYVTSIFKARGVV